MDRRDAPHARALAWAAVVREELVVTEYVLWETVNFASRPPNRPKAHALVSQVRSSGDYELVAASMRLFDAGLELYASRPDNTWSLTDCTSFVVMRERGITRALAFDQHFEQAGFEPLLRRDPDG